MKNVNVQLAALAALALGAGASASVNRVIAQPDASRIAAYGTRGNPKDRNSTSRNRRPAGEGMAAKRASVKARNRKRSRA